MSNKKTNIKDIIADIHSHYKSESSDFVEVKGNQAIILGIKGKLSPDFITSGKPKEKKNNN